MSDLSSAAKCDQNHTSYFINLVTPNARAKHEPLLNKPASEAILLNKSSHLAAAFGWTKFIEITAINLLVL